MIFSNETTKALYTFFEMLFTTCKLFNYNCCDNILYVK